MKAKNKILKTVFFALLIFVLLVLLWNIFHFVDEKISFDSIFHIKLYYYDVDPGYEANVFLFKFLSWIVIFTKDIGSIFIGTFQDVITILFSGSIFYNAIGMDYVTYFWIILGIFFFLLLVFLSIKFFKIGIGKGTSRNIGKNIFNSFVLLIMIIFLFQILFLGSRYFFEKVLGGKIGSLDIFSKIKNLTIDNVNTSEIVHIHNWTFQINLSIEVVEHTFFYFDIDIVVQKAWFTLEKLTISYVIFFIFTTWFVLIMLVKFSFKMMERIINILIFGFAGLPLVAASALNDDGMNLSNWNRMMMKIAFKPLLSISIYLLLLFSMDSIFNIIDSIDVSLKTSDTKEAFVLTLKIVVINGTFLMLNKFGNDWTDNFIKTNRENDVQEFINVNLNNKKNVNYKFNENHSFASNNSINKNITRNISNTKIFNVSNEEEKREQGIDINQTLEKINGKEF